MIIGTGVDIVETDRVLALIEKGGRAFLEKWFGTGEIAYCEAKAHPYIHYAARLAAKEAVYKALRVGRDTALAWKGVAVETDVDGVPRLALSGAALEIARSRGIVTMHVSLSHCRGYAVATVTAEGNPEGRSVP